MTVVKLNFDPAKVTYGTEAHVAFRAGGIVLNVWALWKKHYCTSQHFQEMLEELVIYFDKAFDPEDESVKPYTNIDEFAQVLRSCGMLSQYGFVSEEVRDWLKKYWDHFNLNVRREVMLEYTVTEPVQKLVSTESFGGA